MNSKSTGSEDTGVELELSEVQVVVESMRAIIMTLAVQLRSASPQRAHEVAKMIERNADLIELLPSTVKEELRIALTANTQ